MTAVFPLLERSQHEAQQMVELADVPLRIFRAHVAGFQSKFFVEMRIEIKARMLTGCLNHVLLK
jgi:hypothetical protein